MQLYSLNGSPLLSEELNKNQYIFNPVFTDRASVRHKYLAVLHTSELNYNQRYKHLFSTQHMPA